MDEITFVQDSYYQAHVEASADDAYELITASGGYVFKQDSDSYVTPVMEVSNARSCYENLRNFFNWS